MLLQISFLVLLVGTFIGYSSAECPNACSAHGKCGAYDMCICYRNWVANDCSERMCQFGLAHVDSPKGDLDSSGGALTGPDHKIIVNDQFYPYGTTEQYPQTTDMQGNVITNSAHEYRECSNKGICDRSTGTCACFEGYEGSACQRASCPSNSNGVCSGHGTCQTIQEIAKGDSENIYELWDKDSTMGCVCDAGYEGTDCSQRQCKVGVDPLYYDNNATIRYSNWTYQIYTRSASANVFGNYSIVLKDAYGQSWRTEPIYWNATCSTVATALESIPNKVVPYQSVRCYKHDTTGSYGQIRGIDPIYEDKMYIVTKYTIAFPKNYGRLPQIELDFYLDGSRPTLYTDEAVFETLGYHVYTNGYHGENVDQVPDRCFDVTVTIHTGGTGFDTSDPYTSYLGGLTTAEAKLLKTCLGDSNGDDSDNIEVYNWDYGDFYNPHLIKLQEATQYVPALTTDNDGTTNYDPVLREVPITKLCAYSDINYDLYGEGHCSNANPPGFYAVLYYNDLFAYPFRVYHKISNNYGGTTQFYVYTTTGYLNLVNPNAVVFSTTKNFNSELRIETSYSKYLGMAYADKGIKDNAFTGDMSCESTPIGSYGARDCFNKGDFAMFLQTRNTSAGYTYNPYYPNMYKIDKIWNQEKMRPNATIYPFAKNEISRLQIVLDYSLNARFNFVNGTGKDAAAYAYKFHPPANANGGYLYAQPCAGRGICNTNTGLCECFNGYQGDDCSCMNALAV